MTDITVDRLFRASTCAELAGRSIRIHALSDPDLQVRTRQALLARLRTTKKLADPDSAEYLTLVEPLRTAEPPALRATILVGRAREFSQEAREALPFRYQPIPDGASEAEAAQTLADREAAEKQLALDRQKYADEKLEALSKSLDALDVDKLRAEALRLTQDMAASAAYADEFVWQSVFLSTETQAGQPYFASIEDVRSLGRSALGSLWLKLQEVNDIDPLDLKSPS